jgi:hypothetical protein
MKKGIISIYLLVFGTLFLILFSSVLNFSLTQIKISKQKIAWQKSLEIAEAGINYYRWCLNNEIENNCPLEKEYADISGNVIGKFKVTVEKTMSCNQNISQKIISEGFTFEFPEIKRKVSVLYSRESVAKYAYILNSNVWVGEDHQIRGPYHANGGIRFDGKNFSSVSSAQNNWVCTSSFGCGPSGIGYGQGLCPPECQIINHQCVCPGVFSTTYNSNRGLFSFPVTSFDFQGVSANLAQIKSAAQNLGGIYLPPARYINPQGKGWHLIFLADGRVEAKIITALSATCGYSLEYDGFSLCGTAQEGYWQNNYFTISSEFTYQTFILPSSCSAIFVEDNLWPEGTIKGKVVLASGNLIEANKDTDVILNYNLNYAQGEDNGLTLIAERNILIGPNSPNNMVLKGIFIAQKGRFSRNHYPGNIKDTLRIEGSIISSGRVGTQWVTLGGHIVSGYRSRETFVDLNLLYSPPVFTPFLSPQFKIVKWQEL